jgi:methyl-accepting chemotaxis protein
MKIGTKLVLACASILTVIMMIAFAVMISVTTNASTQSALNSITSLAQSDAGAIKALLERPLNTARIIAQCMQSYQEIDNLDRRGYYNGIMKSVLEENEDILGIWTCWEPNALDGLDRQSRNDVDSDVTGRFIPYWNRSGGEITLTALVDYDKEGVGDYYLLARNSGNETILPPYEYEIDGKMVLLTTVSVPIKDSDGKVVGVAGIDIALSDLQNTAFDNGGFSSVETFVLSNDGTYVINPDHDAAGTQFADEDPDRTAAILSAIAAGQSYQGDGISKSTGKAVNSVFVPILIGNTTTPWSVAIELDKNEIMAATRQMTIIMILIMSALLVFTIATLLLIVRFTINKPMRETADFAKALASGSLDETVAIKSLDEIGQLKSILDNEVRSAFKNIEKAQILSEKQRLYSYEQVDKLVVNLERLASGELYCDMSVSEADEDTEDLYKLYSNISGNLHMSVDAINGYIADISHVLGELSNGNLNVSIHSEYKGDFIRLKDSINGIVMSLNEVLAEINTAADQVAAGTLHVSGGSQEISQGATEQAAAIEQLTATVAKIAEQTRQNALSANQASEISAAAKDGALEGNEQMKSLQQAMQDISKAASSINKIIKVIDDIAFQTNILALNAAVEAAHAGAHGRGFAVVAEEVRNLAAKSAGAAKETKELIKSSIKMTETGTHIADQTASALENIVERVEKTVDLVSEITLASNQQATAITEINRGIEQMSQVVQTNSATAEEAAAASEELSGQAELLKTMVGRFRLRDNVAQSKQNAEKPAAKDIPDALPAKILLTAEEYGKY